MRSCRYCYDFLDPGTVAEKLGIHMQCIPEAEKHQAAVKIKVASYGRRRKDSKDHPIILR